MRPFPVRPYRASLRASLLPYERLYVLRPIRPYVRPYVLSCVLTSVLTSLRVYVFKTLHASLREFLCPYERPYVRTCVLTYIITSLRVNVYKTLRASLHPYVHVAWEVNLLVYANIGF